MPKKRCKAITDDGDRCKNSARYGDYCYIHRSLGEEKIPDPPEPLPPETLATVSVTRWGFCHFCKDAFPMIELRPDTFGLPACKTCWFKAYILGATQPPVREVLPAVLAECARQAGISISEAVAELVVSGFKQLSHPDGMRFIKPEIRK